MGVVLAPVKVDAWKQWVEELNGPRKEDLTDFNRRYGLTRHAAWLAEISSGPFVIALHEGPGGDGLMAKFGPSQHEFDTWFKKKILEVYGLDVTKPPPGPMPELYPNSGS